MKKMCIIILLFFLTYMVNAQTEWQIIQPSSEPLKAICFVDRNIGYAVGGIFGVLNKEESSRILRTTNGGKNWSLQRSYYNRRLDAVHFIDPDYGFAVGPQGTVVKTTNGGIDWLGCFLDDNIDCDAVYVLDRMVCFVVGDSGKIFRSLDGGKKWERIQSNTLNYLFSISFLNKKIGFISGSKGLILNTTDGGNTWAPKNTSTTKDIISIQLIDSTVGYACGGLSCVGGAFLYAYHYFVNGEFNDPKDAIILKTIDGGNNWNIINQNQYSSLNSISLLNCTTGYACGYNVESFERDENGFMLQDNPIILFTNDGGKNWAECEIEKDKFTTKLELESVVMVDSLNSFIVGNNAILKSVTDNK